jgi:hypothetical protein
VGADGVARLVGRGVIDAKGIAASMIVAWQRLLTTSTAVGENVNATGGEVLQNAHLICQASIRNSLGFVA